MIFCDRLLDKKHFDAISKAAANIGESKAYISLIGDYGVVKKEKLYERIEIENDFLNNDEGKKPFKGNFEDRKHFLIELDYHEYEDLVTRDYPLELPLSVLDHAVYSTKGTWGISFEEDYALVGGSPAFMDSLKSYLPGIEDEVYEYLLFMKEALTSYANKGFVSLWLPSVIEHIYGSSKARSMLEEAGLGSLLSQ